MGLTQTRRKFRSPSVSIHTHGACEVLAPIEMIVSRSLPDKNLRFRDCDPNYSVQEDVPGSAGARRG